jgi:Fic family protein
MRAWDINFQMRVKADQPGIVTLVADCRAMARVIRNIPITPGRQDRINRLNILRAVRGTTGIEGAELTELEVRMILEAGSKKMVLPASRKREEQEARNAQNVMDYVASQLTLHPDTELTEELICKLHELTTESIEYQFNTPGKYRTISVTAGDYVPPIEIKEISKLMGQFIKWLNTGTPQDWDPIIRAIVTHFYIVSIHPFGDGNGRTSRAAESFLLYKAGINARGFYSLANFYYRNRDEYFLLLNKIRFETKGDMTPFVRFALQGLSEELEEVHREVLNEVKQISFRDFAREKLQDKLDSKSGKRMLDLLIKLDTAIVDVKAIRQDEHALSKLYRGLTPRTLARDIAFLENQSLIIVDKGKIAANINVMEKFTS